jgi:hypothetical protein
MHYTIAAFLLIIGEMGPEPQSDAALTQTHLNDVVQQNMFPANPKKLAGCLLTVLEILETKVVDPD